MPALLSKLNLNIDQDRVFNRVLEDVYIKNKVQYEELQIPMRQESDLEFAEMLKRWRVGVCTEEDRDFLDKKSEKFLKEFTDGAVSEFEKCFEKSKSLMILAHTNKVTGFLNKTITHKIFHSLPLSNVARTTYTHHKDATISNKQHQMMFQVGEGSRVQINRNVIPGFINGATGSIHNKETEEDCIISMDIRLDSSDSPVHFPPFKTLLKSDSKSEIWLSEYPIHSAYAVTYHKAQGQTLDNVFLATTRSLPPALFYVGASRVRTREGLHILNAGDTIKADPEALDEYMRLRVSTGRPPLPI